MSSDYDGAVANTMGVGIACFATQEEQRLAFERAFQKEAIVARPYIAQLRDEIARLRAERDELLGICVRTRQLYHIELRDQFGLIDAAIAKAEKRNA